MSRYLLSKESRKLKNDNHVVELFYYYYNYTYLLQKHNITTIYTIGPRLHGGGGGMHFLLQRPELLREISTKLKLDIHKGNFCAQGIKYLNI